MLPRADADLLAKTMVDLEALLERSGVAERPALSLAALAAVSRGFLSRLGRATNAKGVEALTHHDSYRHILGLSGGKDSTALAVYMRDRIPEMEYVFCDTQKELPETYEYLDRLEAYLGKPVKRLNDKRGFDHWLKVYGNYLPSSRMRWCTRMLKLKPLEEEIGDDPVLSYVAIRADEDRDGYISTKPNIKPVYPFKEAGITLPDVQRILDDCRFGSTEVLRMEDEIWVLFLFLPAQGRVDRPQGTASGFVRESKGLREDRSGNW